MPAMDLSALPDKAAFAAANGWQYRPVAGGPPQFIGSMFDYLQDATVTDIFQVAGSASGPASEVGIVTGKIGGGQAYPNTGGHVSVSFTTNEVATVGYLAIQLERELPQYVLDAKTNNKGGWSSVIMPIARGQEISLEGDFDSHFTLYGPKGYETDARYVFAPDLMGLLIDETGDFDVEIVGDKLFVYSRGGFDLSSADLWARLDRIRAVVGAKALRQTGRYADASGGTPRLRLGFFGSRSKVGLILAVALISSVVILVLGFVVSGLVFFLV